MYEIEQVIKHRKPMRLVDKLLSFDEDNAQVLVNITAQSPFFSSKLDGVPNYVGIEYMAQSIAAYAGANALSNGKAVQLGFLLGTRKYQPEVTSFNCGQQLLVCVSKIIEDSSGLSVFDCKIFDENNNEIPLAQAKINVFQPENVDKYLQEQ